MKTKSRAEFLAVDDCAGFIGVRLAWAHSVLLNVLHTSACNPSIRLHQDRRNVSVRHHIPARTIQCQNDQNPSQHIVPNYEANLLGHPPHGCVHTADTIQVDYCWLGRVTGTTCGCRASPNTTNSGKLSFQRLKAPWVHVAKLPWCLESKG